jgi:AcrR family transcriptional regulator
MSVRVARRRAAIRRDTAAALLDAAVEVLVADPSASLSDVALAAGIGRTTLHKHYATRDDLLRAVGHRAIGRWEQVVASAESSTDPDGGLRGLAEAMISVGPYLAFLWRSPGFDHAEDIIARRREVAPRVLAVLKRAQARGLLRTDVEDFWLLRTFYSVVYVAADSIDDGNLAPLAAPALIVDTLTRGLGNPP